MATRMQQRRGTASQWTSANPKLAAGEIGFEIDTTKFKIGDGTNFWADLEYFIDASQILGMAPNALDTLEELANAINDDAGFYSSMLSTMDSKDQAIANGLTNSFANSLGNAIDAFSLITSNVHGISNTLALVYSSDVSSHVNANTNVHGISNTASLVYQVDLNNHIDNNSNVHGISNILNIAYKNELNDHKNATANVHGISDSANLAYLEDLDNHNGDTSNVHGIANTLELATESYVVSAANAVSNALDTHNLANVNVHGIANTAALATKSYADTAKSEAITAAGTAADTKISNAVAALTKSSVGLGNADNTSDANKPVSTATQTALDLKANLAGPTFTGTVAGITKSMVGLGSVDNTTDAAKPVSTATQTALDLKANLAGPTFTGTVSGITKSMVGLGSVDNTADSAKPVSTAQQTALDAKLALAGGTMTGALTLSGAPTSDLHAATKQYVDNVTAGINFHEAVHAASVSSLSANYANGTSGVGATLTANTNRAFSTLDGESVALGQRVLIKDQTDAKQNGIYTLTTVGSGSAPWVLTRATDADNNPTGELKNGDFCLVINGTVNASYGFINNSATNPIVIGTDNITYAEFSAGKTIVAGSGLTETTPGTLSVATGGVTSAMIADGAIVDANVNASAAIAQSKISGLTSDLAAKAPLAGPTFTGTVSGITKSMVGLGNVDNTADSAKPVSTATQTALDAKLDSATASTTYAPLASPTFTGTVTVAANGIAFTDGTQTKEGVPSRTSIISKTENYTLSALSERDSLIEVDSTSPITITIPTNSAVAFPVGTTLDILGINTGLITIEGNTGVTVNSTPGLKLRTQWSSCTLFKRGTDAWVVYGDLKA